MEIQGSDLLTVREAADALGLPKRTVSYRLLRGIMQGVRIGNRLWLVPRDEVDRWRERGKLQPGPKPRAHR